MNPLFPPGRAPYGIAEYDRMRETIRTSLEQRLAGRKNNQETHAVARAMVREMVSRIRASCPEGFLTLLGPTPPPIEDVTSEDDLHAGIMRMNIPIMLPQFYVGSYPVHEPDRSPDRFNYNVYVAKPRAPAVVRKLGVADPSRYPHTCPKCKAPAYIGFAKIDCYRGCS